MSDWGWLWMTLWLEVWLFLTSILSHNLKQRLALRWRLSVKINIKYNNFSSYVERREYYFLWLSMLGISMWEKRIYKKNIRGRSLIATKRKKKKTENELFFLWKLNIIIVSWFCLSFSLKINTSLEDRYS